MKRKTIVLVCVAAMAISLLSGCGNTDAKEKAVKLDSTTKNQNEESTFTAAINYMPSSLLPNTASDDYTSMIRPIYEPLFADSKDGMVYYLADSLEISEDAMTYTIHINPKANWSDGEPVTVEDILFTIKYSRQKSGGTSSYDTINGEKVVITKKDDGTLIQQTWSLQERIRFRKSTMIVWCS